jgi:hypothetical protein
MLLFSDGRWGLANRVIDAVFQHLRQNAARIAWADFPSEHELEACVEWRDSASLKPLAPRPPCWAMLEYEG